MDADENSSTKSKDSSTTSILRNVSIKRPRRGTLSGGDGTSSSTKQKITTAINQIVHRRASISTQRPKDLAAIIIPRTEPLTQGRNTPPTSPNTDKNVLQQQLQMQSQQLKQQQQQQQQAEQEQRQSQGFINIMRSKSPRPLSSHSSQHSPTQSSFPLAFTAEEVSSVDNNTISTNNDSINKNGDNRRLHGSSSSNSSFSSQKRSLFTRDNKNVPKDDRMEKLLKKAKNFLDHKQRPKARVTSLWSFIDVTNELDQAQFFQQHAEDVFDVTYKSFMGQVDKIKQKSERPMSFSSKEFLNINKTLLLLRKIFLFLPDKIRVGWQRRKIAEMLSQLLDHGNHHRVRIQGFQLLLLWINDQTIELTECTHLYANVISMDLFFHDQIRIGNDEYQGKDNWRRSNRPISLGQKSIKADDRGPLFPHPHPPTFHDATCLIQMDLGSLVRLAHVAAGSTPPPENHEFPVNENAEPDNGIAIGMGIDAALAAAKFHFELTKKQYLVKLFPQCAKKLSLIPENQEIGFQKCPPTILRSFITFLIHHCLDNHDAISDAISPCPSPATPILKSIVLGAENREFAHEIVRQALMLPAGSPLYKDIVRGAVHIVGVWILSGEEERPVFLRKSPSPPQPPHSAYSSFSSSIFASSSHTSLPSPEYQSEPSFSPVSTPLSAASFSTTYANANVYLRRYIVLLTLVFEDHSLLINDGGITSIEVDAQVSIYKDVLALYRSIMAEGPIELEPATWETLLSSLLDTQERIMNQSNKYAPVPSITLADDLADYLVETVLYAFARSKVQQPELWRALTNQMSISLRWSQTVSQWAKIMLRMTKVLSKNIYHVDLDAVELNRRLSTTPERHFHRRRPSKNRTRHLSLRGAYRHKSSGSNSSREEILGPDFSASVKSANESRKSSRRPMSMHQDIGSFESKSQTLLNIGTTVFNGGGSSVHSGSVASDEDDQGDDDDDYFDASSEIAADDAAEVKSNRTSSSSVFFAQPNFSSDKLSISLANFRCPDFIHIEALSWSAESALLVWKNLLCALGNLNYIQISPNHAEAMKCLVDILDMLSLIRNNQYGNFPLPLLFDFAPWLFDACDLPLAFAPGRALAYAGLCKMMSFPHDKDFDEEYYPHFYRALLKGLSDQEDYLIINAIINNSTRLFSQNLPGCNILYRSFIENIRNLITKHDYNVPEVTIQNAITILCSLICIINQLPTLQVPNIPYKNLTKMNEEELNESEFSKLDSIKFSELRLMLQETLVSALSNEETVSNYETHNMLLHGLCTLAFDELTATPWPDKTIIKGCFQALLEQLFWNHLPVVTVAADCLITFAQNSSLWGESDVYFMILQDVFGNLIGSLNEHLALQKASYKSGRGFIIAKIFYCLLEWLMIIPPNLFTDTELCQLVFDAIEMAFELSNLELNKNQKKKYSMSLYKNKGKNLNNDYPVRFKKAERKVSLDNALEHDHNISIDNSVEDINFIKEIAEFVLLHLTHHLDNFSPIHGPAMMHSTLVGPVVADTKDEEVSNNYHYFSFNDTTIITLVEIPGKDSSASRMIIRDFTGKYSWDSKLFYESKPSHTESNSIKSNNTVCENMIFRSGIKVESNSKPDTDPTSLKAESRNRPKDKNSLPVWTENYQSGQANMLNNLLKYVGEKTSSVLYPPSSTSGIQSDLLLLEKELDRHIEEEILYDKATDSQAQSWYDNVISLRNNTLREDNKTFNRLSRNPLYSRSTSHSSLGADFSLSKSFLPVLPSATEKPSEPYQQCRLFLSHFGWLTPESLNDGTICVLNKGNTLFRDIRLLDKRHAREVFKFALLYVGPGQEDEQSILHNTSGSEKYNEFVHSLGWEIDLSTHPGYLGGLERNCSNGLTAIYYCTSTIEVIFHDVTKMPTDPNDPKQLRKKRHIGNDHVHIVWNEHQRDYRKSTIGGDFGNVQIVISPLPNGLYDVDIYRDSKIPPFGPLLHGMVISRNVLGPLVRITAIQAFRNSLHNINSTNSTIYQHPYMERAADIQMIMSKYKNNNCSTSEAFMSKIFFSEDLLV